jgi:hypothetical protein
MHKYANLVTLKYHPLKGVVSTVIISDLSAFVTTGQITLPFFNQYMFNS